MKDKDKTKERLLNELIELRERVAELEKLESQREQAGKKNEHLASFPQLNPDPVIEIDEKGMVTFSNAATAEVLKTLGIEDDASIFLPDDFEEIIKALEPEKENQSFYREVEIKDKIFAESIHLSKELRAWRIYVHDVTERKRAKEALHQSEAKYRVLADSISDPFFALKKDLRFTYWNRASETNTGITADSIIGKFLFDVFPELRGTPLEHAYNQAIATGKIQFLENRRDHQGGEVTYHDVSVYPTTEGIAVFSRDVTDRKRAEDGLRKLIKDLEILVQDRTEELEKANKKSKSEIAERKMAGEQLLERSALLRKEIIERRQAEEKILERALLLDQTRDAIAVRDLEQRLTYWNKGAERLYGWTVDEIIGKNADELLYKEESPQLIEAKNRVIEKGEWSDELRQVTKGGKEIIVDSRWTLTYDRKGKPKSILIINTDITEKKKIEIQFLRSQRLESIGTLAGGIAHDINNILTPIMLSVQILREKITDEQGGKLLDILEKNTKRGADMMKQVLSFSRGVEVERKPIQVNHIISEIEKVVRETFPKSIEIRNHLSKDLKEVRGDATQLHQVLMNLCINARDAMPEGGILDISAKNLFIDENLVRMNIEARVGQYIVITVSDTGRGIPAEILDRIFEPFFTTKQPGKGTGLGLSTSLKIVRSHSGFIDVHSEVGKGTTFKVYLPAETTTEMQELELEQNEPHAGNGEVIFVVDDEDTIREVTGAILETNGYRVITASDGVEAISLYTENREKIKVVLMDMTMPVMDGPACIQALHKINPDAKIIAVSGLIEKKTYSKVADNVDAFLIKPYTAEKLLKTIQEV